MADPDLIYPAKKIRIALEKLKQYWLNNPAEHPTTKENCVLFKRFSFYYLFF